MPKATFVGQSQVAGTGASVVVPAPTGLASGDHQLIIAVSGTSGSAIAVSGFTQAGRFSGTAGDSSVNVSAFIASASTATDPITITNPANGRLFVVSRLAWRGGPGWLTTPAPTTTTRASGLTHALPTQDTTAAEQLVVGAIVYDTGDGAGIATTFTEPTGWTPRPAVDTADGSTFERIAIGVFEIERTASGTQSGTVTASRADASFVFAATLAPAAPTHTTLRTYLSNTPADKKPTTDPGIEWSGYDPNNVDNPLLLSNDPSGPAAWRGLGEESSTSPYYVHIGTWITGAVEQTGKIPANVSWKLTFARFQTHADADLYTQVGAWVMASDGSRKAQILSRTDNVEWPVTSTATPTNAVAVEFTITGHTADVTLDPGDRIVFELGYRAMNTSTAQYLGGLIHGGTDSTDLAPGDTGSTSTRPAWVEIPVSQGVTLAPPAEALDERIRDYTTGRFTTNTFDYPIILPDYEIGDLLVVGFANDTQTAVVTVNDPAWEILGSMGEGQSTNHRLTIVAKRATGDDDLTFFTDTSEQATYIAWSIIASKDPIISNPDTGGSTSTAAGFVPLSVPEDEYLSLLFVATDSSMTTNQAITSIPAGYSTPIAQNPDSTQSAAIFSMYDRVTGTSIAPGNAGYNVAEQFVSYHVAIPLSDAPQGPEPGRMLIAYA
jgi:hypothetical protein